MSQARWKAGFYAGLIAASLLGGCVMDLPNGTVVNRPRVLGVRIDVEGDPTRAEPRPGESVTLRWLVVPGGDAWMSALTACVAAPANTGFPGCAEAPFAFAPPGTPSPSPSFALSVPVGAAGRSILVAGVLCANGVPTLPEEGLPDCEGEDATTERVIFTFDVAGDAPPNQHPSWAEQTFTIDEQAWDAPPAELPTSGCAAVAGAPALPRITRRIEDEPSTITFTTRAEDRETYDELVLGEMPTFETRREDLRITHAATGGFFPRLSTEVFDDEAPTPNVPWRHPTEEEVPEDGLTVRFWFVMRDGRGGMDWIERAACVVR